MFMVWLPKHIRWNEPGALLAPLSIQVRLRSVSSD